jgi:hypothetical protein
MRADEKTSRHYSRVNGASRNARRFREPTLIAPLAANKRTSRRLRGLTRAISVTTGTNSKTRT